MICFPFFSILTTLVNECAISAVVVGDAEIDIAIISNELVVVHLLPVVGSLLLARRCERSLVLLLLELLLLHQSGHVYGALLLVTR